MSLLSEESNFNKWKMCVLGICGHITDILLTWVYDMIK